MRTLTYAHTHHACAHTRRHTCVSTCSAPIKLKDYLGEPARRFHFLTFNCSKCPILMHFTPTPPPQVRTGRLGTQEALARPLLPEGGPRPRLRRHGLVVPVSASACAALCFGRSRRFGSSHPASCPGRRPAAAPCAPCRAAFRPVLNAHFTHSSITGTCPVSSFGLSCLLLLWPVYAH